MSKLIIFGYKAGSDDAPIVNIKDLEMILLSMKKAVMDEAQVRYNTLLIRQIERIVDEIALGRFTRDPNTSILDIAKNETLRRIQYADRNMHPTEYNLSAGVQVLSLSDKKGRPVTYLKVNCPGSEDIYAKKFRKIKELIPYSIYEQDFDEKNEKVRIWEDMGHKYSEDMPLCYDLFSYQGLEYYGDSIESAIREKAKFRGPKERAEELAMEETANYALAMYSTGGEIQPHKLFEYVFEAELRMQRPEFTEFKLEKKNQLMAFLPVITDELIRKRGNPLKPQEQKHHAEISSPEKEEDSCGSENAMNDVNSENATQEATGDKGLETKDKEKKDA